MIYLSTAIGLTPGGSSTVQYSTVQYGTVQYSAVQYSTVQYGAVQYSTVRCSTVQYSTVQYSIVHIHTQIIHRTTQLTTLVGRLSGIRTQSGQTKIIVHGTVRITSKLQFHIFPLHLSTKV